VFDGAMLTFPIRYLIILLGAVILLAACSSPPGNATAPPAGQEQAVKYAQCMRAHGVPDFPDPDPSGQFRGLGHEQRDNPKFRSAQQACRGLAPGGEHEKLGDPASVNQVRKFAQCMRAHGLPDFPDPDAQGRLRGAGHEQQGDPKYRAAFEACRAKLPGGGEHQ
jgi:hypothetical protein